MIMWSVLFHFLFPNYGSVGSVSMFLMMETKMARMREGEIGILEVMQK